MVVEKSRAITRLDSGLVEGRCRVAMTWVWVWYKETPAYSLGWVSGASGGEGPYRSRLISRLISRLTSRLTSGSAAITTIISLLMTPSGFRQVPQIGTACWVHEALYSLHMGGS